MVEEGEVAGLPLPPQVEAWLDGVLGVENGLAEVLHRLHAIGCRTWLVGGCVRDVLGGASRAPHDVDLAVDMEPAQLLEAFGSRAKDTGSTFGTVTLLALNGEPFQATTLRIDGTYIDGRRPEHVEHTTELTDDLRRRDLTINAMAIDPVQRVLFDHHGGAEDLDNAVLRAVGAPSLRLQEDALRILRVYRFAAGRAPQGAKWRIESSLRRALMAERDGLQRVARERIWHEFFRLLCAPEAWHALWMMHEDGTLPLVLPEGALAGSGIDVLDGEEGENAGMERLTLLLAAEDEGRIPVLLRELTAPRRTIERVRKLHRGLLQEPPRSAAQIRLMKHRWGEAWTSHVRVAQAFETANGGEAWASASSQIHETPEARAPEALLDGLMIMEATGLQKGERLGRLKEWLHRVQIERDIDTSSTMLDVLCGIQWSGPFEAWPRM